MFTSREIALRRKVIFTAYREGKITQETYHRLLEELDQMEEKFNLKKKNNEDRNNLLSV